MVPVLAATDVGTAIWIILVVIGVISSIIKNARKNAQPARPVQQQQRAAAPPTVTEMPRAIAPEPVAPPPIIVARRPVVVPSSKAPSQGTAPVQAVQPGETLPFRGMFERGNLVRAVVAAEVLGPPKALQEQSIWSPRHNAPSI